MKKNFYECTYIINPVLEDEQIRKAVELVHDLIQKNDGEIDETDEWGLRPLAYDMDGKGNGYFVNLYFHAPAAAIEVIERNMRLNDNIIRYMTLKYDANMLRHRELLKKGVKPTIFEEVEEESDSDDQD